MRSAADATTGERANGTTQLAGGTPVTTMKPVHP